ncbi:hypothetical protein OXPF_19910 [Oxobacter pfennigii]|uniref:Uroporphyrinogen decarboxylase (URO-D) n=1 Tax=Oxobacter pfennigii TaxID=36849 RepID=A0A0P8WPM5_9CLOT|nr:hypothetical protein [Oxobacter pfennigii]KPU44497.1 hypothetical protein OXPF_19910 [Oxobacter pfennigii]
MENEKIYNDRVKNFVDATSFKEPDKVPVGMEFLMWPFAYAGTTYKAVMDDPVLTAQTYTKFLDEVNLDFYWGGTISRPLKTNEILGCYDYALAKDDTCIEHIQVNEEYMTADEYEDLIKDPNTFRYETMLKRHYTAFNLPKEQAYEKLKEAAIEYKKYQTANRLITKNIHEDRKVLAITNSPLSFYSPFNVLFDILRGITNSLTDLRRRPDTVRKACDVIWEQFLKDFKYKPEDFKDKPFPLGRTVYHSECFLSPSLFDELFFNKFREQFLPFMEVGVKFFLKGEGHFINTLDRYRQLPNGAMVMMLDEDDPFEVHKVIGDWATLATGIRADLLQFGTKQQCIDYVKKCFDTFAPGGGFVFMQNKPLLCANDAKIENLIAVYEFANEYGKK